MTLFPWNTNILALLAVYDHVIDGKVIMIGFMVESASMMLKLVLFGLKTDSSLVLVKLS